MSLHPPEGSMVPAAFGLHADWLANLRAPPESRVVCDGATYDTITEVTDLKQAIE